MASVSIVFLKQNGGRVSAYFVSAKTAKGVGATWCVQPLVRGEGHDSGDLGTKKDKKKKKKWQDAVAVTHNI